MKQCEREAEAAYNRVTDKPSLTKTERTKGEVVARERERERENEKDREINTFFLETALCCFPLADDSRTGPTKSW